jgi:hypothetical protein
VTLEELRDIRIRDGLTSATWFTGPASFPARAARDRRELLAVVENLCEQLRLAGQVPLLDGVPNPNRVSGA